MLDAADRRTLAQAAIYLGLGVVGVPAVAAVLGVSVRIFRLVAGV